MKLEPVTGAVQAHADWGANCGPVALAAALELPLDHIRIAVSPRGRFKGYMGVRDLREAIAVSGHKIDRSWSKPMGSTDVLEFSHYLGDAIKRMRIGDGPILVLIRFCGPWDGIPRAAATYRHVVCYRHVNADGWEHEQRLSGPGFVLDANQLDADGSAYWMPARFWARRTLCDLLPERGDGRVAIDWIAEVGKQSNA